MNHKIGKIKYRNKRVNSIKEGIRFTLTYNEYCLLLKRAGIKFTDIGPKGYHLSRYNDTGAYSINNCRFIWYLNNIRERKISNLSRQNSRKNIKKASKILNKKSKEELRYFKSKGGKISGGRNKLSEKEINKRNEIIKNSGIDLNNYGSNSKISKLLNLSHTSVRRYLLKYYI